MPQLILMSNKDASVVSISADKMMSIKSEAEELRKELEHLRSEAQIYLEDKHRENSEYLPTIRNAIAFLPASTRVEQIPLFGWKQQTEISSAAAFSNVFSMLKQVCEFPDSSLLEHIVRLFGSVQLQMKMLAYAEKLQAFRSHTKVSDFTKACTLDSTLPVESSILTVKIGREWHRSTLEDIEQLRQAMVQKASLTSYGMRLLQVEWDQGLLHWCVPSRALQSLVGSLDSKFLQENHVEILSINGTNLQSTQTAGLAVNPLQSSVNPTPVHSPLPSSATVFQSRSGPMNLLPLSPPSATGGQTGQPLSLHDQLAVMGAQVVQFKPAVTLANSDAKQQISSPTILTPSSTYNPYPPQPTAIQIIHPQPVPSSSGASHINMGRPAAVPVVQHPGSSQPIQIIHPQIIQPNALQGGSGGGKHSTQPPQVILRGQPDGEILKVGQATPSDRKPSLTQDGFMVMHGGPNGNSLVLVPSYVMVNPTGRQKRASLSSPPSSSGGTTTILSPAGLDRKSAGITPQGLATLLQPGTPVSPLFTTAQSTKAISVNSVFPASGSGSPVLTFTPGQSKLYENSIVSVPNPGVSNSIPLRSVTGSSPEHSVLLDMNSGRPVTTTQLKSLNHICNFCGNGYMWASSLKRHMHTHSSESLEPVLDISRPPPEPLQEPPAKKKKPIECQICNQMIESPAAYTRHLRLHMKVEYNPPRYHCTQCDILFATATSYEDHCLQMHRCKESVRDSVGGDGLENGESGLEGREEERRDVEDGGEEGAKEGEREGENGESGAQEMKREEKSESASSGSDHSSDSASDAEEAMETAEPRQPPTNHIPHSGGETAPHEPVPSTGTGQEAATLPATPTSGSLPFNQLLQLVGNREGEESMEDGSSRDVESTGARRFRCDECGRYLSSQAALSGHQLCMHNKQKPHICHICNKGFFQSHSLTVHLRSHSGEKPYSCIVCSKSFSQRSSLNIHIRTHSGERPYQCPFCSRGFSDSSTLAKHRRTHTGERPYQCRECGASFSQSGNLWRHMKQVHPAAAGTT